MSNLLDARGLVKTYGAKKVLDGVNLAVSEGCIAGFVGANGAGKTTTIRAILGLMPLDEGEVRLFGEIFDIHADQATNRRIKNRIGIVLDTCPYIGELSIKETEAIMRHAYDTWEPEVFGRHLAAFGLDPKAKVKDLSRGMGMKLQLACALSHNPDLLILDEATAGLDPLAREEVLDVLRDFVSDGARAILISTHITSDLEKIADTVTCIDEGRTAFSLEKDAITDRMGKARCRASQLEAVLQFEHARGAAAKLAQREHGIDVLVEDRCDFIRRFPDIPCERLGIDDYMQFVLKGDTQ